MIETAIATSILVTAMNIFIAVYAYRRILKPKFDEIASLGPQIITAFTTLTDVIKNKNQFQEMGVASGQSRGMKAMNREALGGSGLIGSILSESATATKWASKYPFIVPLLEGMVQKYMANAAIPIETPAQGQRKLGL